MGDILDVKILLRLRGIVQPLRQHLIGTVSAQCCQRWGCLVVQILLKFCKQCRINVHDGRLTEQAIIGLFDELLLVEQWDAGGQLILFDGALGGQQHEVGRDAAGLAKLGQRLDILFGLSLVGLTDVLNQNVVADEDSAKLLDSSCHLQLHRQFGKLPGKGQVFCHRLLDLFQVFPQRIISVIVGKALPCCQRPHAACAQQQNQQQTGQHFFLFLQQLFE